MVAVKQATLAEDMLLLDGSIDSPVSSGKQISLYTAAAVFAVRDTAIIITMGYGLGYMCSGFGPLGLDRDGRQGAAMTFVLSLHLVFCYLCRIYSVDHLLMLRRGLMRIWVCCILDCFMVLLWAPATGWNSISLWWSLAWILVSFGVIVILRVLSTNRIVRDLHRGAYIYKALSIGIFTEPIASSEIARKTNYMERVTDSLFLEAMPDFASLADRIATDEIDRVYIAAPWDYVPSVFQNLYPIQHLSTRVYVMPADVNSDVQLHDVGMLGERPHFCAIIEPIHGWSLWLKRCEDIVVASVVLFVTAPLLAAVAIAIRLDSPGDIFFRQVRVGFNGKRFKVWKFRSMYAHATDHDASIQTSKCDPRVTRVGAFIRRMSIDEIPQLFNVIEGTMSIVGPRPHALATRAEGKHLEELVDYYVVRHRVRPGITGLAQIHGFRGELTSLDALRKRVDLDIAYIDNWSILLDLKIILQTLFLVLVDKNAY